MKEVAILQIHVVRPMESLFTIAQAYGIPMNQLIQVNEIPNPNQLVVGQTLIIPIVGKFHWVSPGESLYTISQMYNISMSELTRINQIASPAQIVPGTRLYIPPTPRPTVDVGAYIDPAVTRERSVEEINKVGEHLTFLTIFSYHINRDGTLSPLVDQPLINAAYQDDVAPLMVLANIEDGAFSTELATLLLTDEALQDKVLEESIRIMKEKGYLGLDFDLEYLGAENRERYNAFLRKAAARLRAEGFFISSALAPKTEDDQVGVLYEGHDYAAHGEIVDFIFFMTYEWGWSGGPPMAVSPINQVRRVMEYAVSRVPRNKIMMGIPLYGYDWTLPYVPGGRWAKVISPQQAIQLAAQYNVPIQYDPVAQAPHFNYQDAAGNTHEVWFEDARSIQAKFNLVKELGLRGFFYWSLGPAFPQNWLLIQDNFTVRKRVSP